MSKARGSVGQRKRPVGRRRRRDAGRWLPWGIGGAVLLVVALVVLRSVLQPKSPGQGPRDFEWLSGVTGVSYDAGETAYPYPNPADFAEGRKWLPALGDEDAPVVVMEFSDIYCGHCRDFNLDALPGILEDYVASGKVRWTDHFFGFNRTLQEGTVLALMCAAEQGRYFEFKHTLFQSLEVGSMDADRAARVAGLDESQLEACVGDDRYLPAIQEMLFEDNRGVDATPTFFVNGRMVSGNVPGEVRAAIEDALANP